MTSDVPARFAVFSDIHANLAALSRFLEHADTLGYEALFCLGDIVGYGAHPNECCDLVRRRGIPSVLGNHDLVALTLERAETFNEIARQAIQWTHDQLRPDNADFLRTLPYLRVAGDYTFVHGSPWSPEEWHYVLTHSDAQASFSAFDTPICFIGHSHQPFAVELHDGRIACPEPGEIPLRKDSRYLINVGSLGQPRDGNPDSSYVVVDRERNTLRFERLAYPVEEARRAIEEAGLPGELAYRLSVGL